MSTSSAASSPAGSTRLDGFLAGWAYGAASVLVGQPFETLKTKQQMMQSAAASPSSKSSFSSFSSLSIAKSILETEGLGGLYRGGLSLLIGGAVIRSTQFGVNSVVLTALQSRFGKTRPEDRWVMRHLDPQVILSGLAGGIARGLVESPFEFVKVRRQVDVPWRFTEVWQGSGATVFRNSFLFSSFVIYMDVSKQYVQLSPFWLGAICASAAWLTIWPLDVVKTKIQAQASTNRSSSSSSSYMKVLAEVSRSGALYRGLGPGLVRSTLSNGVAMMAFKEVERLLQESRCQK